MGSCSLYNHEATMRVMCGVMTCIGFSEAAARGLVTEEQGIDALEEVKQLSDDKIDPRVSAR